MKYILISTLLVFCVNLQAQVSNNLAVVKEEVTHYIPTYERQGIVYFDIRHFAEALSVNYYLNPDAGKIELKFPDYSLKISSKNPYFIVTKRSTNQTEIFQLPTSTYLINGEIFIPLKYSLDVIKYSLGIDIEAGGKYKLIVSDKPFTSEKKDESDWENRNESGFDVTGIALEEKANGTLVRVFSKKTIPSYNSSIKNDELTIILREVNADVDRINRTPVEGLVKELYATNIGSDLELKFKLSDDYTASDVINAGSGNDILITLHNKIFSGNNTERNKSRWKFDVIVIDAGHGGVDGGTVGVGGIKEKNINLGIALKLGKLIEKNMKDVKVVYTRKTDKAVDLYKRGKIPTENDGNLFISIHCNSTPKKPSDANGFEVYLLRPGRTKEAIEIAERENSVIKYEENPDRYQQLTDENFILVSMAHSAYMKYSEKFADYLNKEFSHQSKIKTRGVKQAGFYVLVGASMPSVLVESGFLSNKNDAAYLKSPKGQQKIAELIFDAIKKYKSFYEKEIESEK